VADQYRKLRNTFRYLLGALDGFSEAERVGVEDMPELERYMLALLEKLDAADAAGGAGLRFQHLCPRAYRASATRTSLRSSSISCKDCLYCDAPTSSAKRRAYRTVLDTLFHALGALCRAGPGVHG